MVERGPLRNGGEAALVGVLIFALYLFTLAPDVHVGDSGELITASALLGVAHPPGYALYTLIGKTALQLPLGAPACRMNLLSALFAAAAAGLLYQSILKIARSRPAALFSSLALALSPTFWSQAVVAEVYALSLLLFLAVPFLLLNGMGGRGFLLACYMAGAGAAHHPIGIFYLPLFVVLMITLRRKPDARLVSVGALLFLLAWTVVLYLPLRGASDAPLRWGETTTLSGLLMHVTRISYHDYPGVEPLAAAVPFLTELKLFGGLIARELSVPVLALAAFGLLFLFFRRRAWAFLLLGALLAGSAGLLLMIDLRPAAHVVHDNRVFFQPVVLLLTGLAGIGLWGLSRVARIRSLPFLFLLLLVRPLTAGLEEQDRSGDHLAGDIARFFLEPLERDAVLHVTEGQILFPLLYLQQVEGVRPDVRIEAPRAVFHPAAAGGGPLHFSSRESAAGRRVVPYGISLRAAAPGETYEWKEEWDRLRPRLSRSLDPMEREVLFGFHLRYARNLAMAGREERAREELEEARLLAGRTEDGVIHLAKAYHEAGFREEALALFRERAASSPGDWRSGMMSGVLLAELGRRDEAIQALKDIRLLVPDQPEPCFYLSNLLLLAGEREEAVRIGRIGRRLAPDHPMTKPLRSALGLAEW